MAIACGFEFKQFRADGSRKDAERWKVFLVP